MDATETSSSSDSHIDDGDDIPINGNKISDELRESQIENASLIAELEALRQSYQKLEAKSSVAEERLSLLEKQKDEALKHNLELLKAIRVFSEQLVSLKSVKECLVRVIEGLDEGKVGIFVDECEEISGEKELDEELRAFFGEVKVVSKLASTMEVKLGEYQETRKKVRRELENSVVSLTEENRDINSLLRIALVEKEAVEKSLNKLKGNSEQKRVAILQIAEKGLQKVGFGFMMGTGANEPAADNSGANSGNKSDGSECEEEVESLASAVERIMKNLRLEITQLRRSLEESRNAFPTVREAYLLKSPEMEKTLSSLQQPTRVSPGSVIKWSNRARWKSSGMEKTSVTPIWTRHRAPAHRSRDLDLSFLVAVAIAVARCRLRCSSPSPSPSPSLIDFSRWSDTERLQSLTEKQAQNIAENALYVKELENREMMLIQNVEELLLEIKETEEEVARWWETCELEVDSGKNVVEERDKVVSILKQELEKTKAALDISNSKLKLKEELAAAAMAAQAAAERSLQLADSRASGLHGRIEELTRQLEEADSKERTRRKVRHICWPWIALKASPPNGTNTRARNFKWMIPEMQALLH
ncbi:pyruvate decarboxylase-2 [Actinidia rufa]|uniref:Pyruvate decarboxylase-2 n=1 Tax=Actinidia rufa TaxID=165716 RepID=A0A7J0GWY9_9ERIC|nr:pyruvate decarboxylase-2 [Actinidia rufa]